jgi:tetratricopeptide (TPR) repeat protein
LKKVITALLLLTYCISFAQTQTTKERAAALRTELSGDIKRAWDTDMYKWNMEKAKKAMRMDDCAEAYYLRGRCYHDLKNNKDALADYAKAIEMDPHYMAPYLYRGYCLSEMEKYTEAMADFNEAVKIQPGNFEPYTGVAGCYYGLKKWDEAQATYLKAMELGNDKASTYYALGRLNLDKGDYRAAVDWFRKQLAINPKDDREYLNKALQLLPDDDKVAAVDKNSKAIAQGCITGNCNTGEGMAMVKSADGKSSWRYKGSFVNGLRNGKGYLIDSTGGDKPYMVIYQGNFNNDKREGKSKAWKKAWNNEKGKWVTTVEWNGYFSNDALNGDASVYFFDASGNGDTIAVLSGTYANNAQKEGKRRYIHYSNYMDGTWVSDDWSRVYSTVKFTPKGTHDVIEGMFENADKEAPFECDGKYYSTRNKKAKTYPFKADGPEWLYKTYWAIQSAADTRKVDGPGVSLEEYDKQKQAMARYNQNNNTTNTQHQVVQRIRTTCSVCFGSCHTSVLEDRSNSSYTTIVRVYSTCYRCHGTGYE